MLIFYHTKSKVESYYIPMNFYICEPKEVKINMNTLDHPKIIIFMFFFWIPLAKN